MTTPSRPLLLRTPTPIGRLPSRASTSSRSPIRPPPQRARTSPLRPKRSPSQRAMPQSKIVRNQRTETKAKAPPSQETRSPEISQAITSLVARKTRRPLCPSSRACGGSCSRLSWPSFSKVSSTSTTITATKLRRGSLAYFPARKDTLDCTPHHHALLRARTCARTIHC